jgi:hypothetical protein
LLVMAVVVPFLLPLLLVLPLASAGLPLVLVPLLDSERCQVSSGVVLEGPRGRITTVLAVLRTAHMHTP